MTRNKQYAIRRPLHMHHIRMRFANAVKLSRRRRIKYVFEVLRDTLIANAFIWVMPANIVAELKLINDTIAATAANQYAQIKYIIYDSWYERFSYNVFCDFDSKVEAFRRGPPLVAAAMQDIKNDDDIAELKKQMVDFVNARSAEWIDSLAPNSLIAALSPALSAPLGN